MLDYSIPIGSHWLIRLIADEGYGLRLKGSFKEVDCFYQPLFMSATGPRLKKLLTGPINEIAIVKTNLQFVWPFLWA